MISPATYLQPGQNPIELEEALRMRGYGTVEFGIETWLHNTGSVEGQDIAEDFIDWNTPAQFECVQFASGNVLVSSAGPPAGTSTATGLHVTITGEKQASGKIASQASAWRLDWLSGKLTLSKGTTAGSGSFIQSPDTASLLNGERFTAHLYLPGSSQLLGRARINLPDGTLKDSSINFTDYTTIDLTGVLTIGNGIVGCVERFRIWASPDTLTQGTALLDMNPQGRDPYSAIFNDPVATGVNWTATDAQVVSHV